ARAESICPNPSEREMDQLLSIGEQETIALTAMALHSIGVPAMSYTGAQAGIFTDNAHTKARIQTIDAKALIKDVKEGNVIIVAGFQGIDKDGRVTTLGRGGSDLTAIALAGAIKADK
ncbi:MAG: aspartate kinase, partial [Opitutaceae bacterium]